MATKLFIGGLSWNTDSAGLQEAFSSYGEVVESKVISDRNTGRSRGFGFLTFANEEDAQKALEMDGKELDGRTVRVAPARDDRPRDGDRD